MAEKNNGVAWVLLNPSIQKTVFSLAEREFSGENLTDDAVRETTVAITQRGAIANAPAMLTAIRVMANTLANYLKASRKELEDSVENEINFSFRPDQHSVVVNDKVCVGICTEPSDFVAKELSIKNPGFTDYLLLNVDSEILYGVRC